MADQEEKDEHKLITEWKRRKGGFRASMFIFVLSALDNMGFVANMVSLVLYFYGVMHFDLSSSANTLTNFMGSTFLLSLVGGFISDTYLNRFTTCLLFGSLEVLALAMLTVQAASNNLHPQACGKSSCVKGGIAVMFYTSLSLLALGMGGVRGSMTAFGADQFDEKDPIEEKALASFFNWLLLSSTLGAITGVTGVVWVSTQRAWHWGFFIITIAATIGFVTLALGKPFYRIKTPGDSSTLRIAQVIFVAFKNRKLSLPESQEELYEISDKDATLEKIAHTNQMRFLDKAAILQENSKPKPWKVCTVTQVEEVKILTRMLPIVGSTIILNTCMAQLQTFSVQQGNVMNLKLGYLTVPAPSIPVIPLIFITILVPIYEFFFVPFARKITHNPSGITQLQRVGVGLVLSAISMAVYIFFQRLQLTTGTMHNLSLWYLLRRPKQYKLYKMKVIFVKIFAFNFSIHGHLNKSIYFLGITYPLPYEIFQAETFVWKQYCAGNLSNFSYQTMLLYFSYHAFLEFLKKVANQTHPQSNLV